MCILLEEIGWIYIYYWQRAYGTEIINGEERAHGAVRCRASLQQSFLEISWLIFKPLPQTKQGFGR